MKNTMRKLFTCIGLIGSMLVSGVELNEIQSAGAVKSKVGNDVVLVFTNTAETGSFTLPKNAKAQVLTVAGGGAGGSMAAVDEIGKGAAGGGGAGGVSHHNTIFAPGTYTVKVGRGGQRVQTIVQAWVGANGENSTISYTNATVFSAKGGGGGGTVKINGNGESGGSGGGASWFKGFTVAGNAVDGQGWAGGISDDENIGGGGGGAYETADLGMGGVDGRGGKGRVIDITGSMIEYGRGGNGGNRAATAPPSDGAGYGFGGDGANITGRGGAGGDGIVVVRVTKLFDYISVPKLQTSSFEWADGKDCVALDIDDPRNAGFKQAVDYIEGTTQVHCSIETVDGQSVTNGLGRFYYAVYLKDEYRWEDESTAPCLVYWRVKEPGTIGEATVDVTKTVEWTNGKDAVIAIDIHTTPEKKASVPNVLMIGGLCSAHGFSQEVLQTSINSVTKVANIDYYFYNKTSTDVAANGHLNKGQTFNTTIQMQSNNHGCLAGFYDGVRRAIDSGVAYDYVIFIFDRTKVATDFPDSRPAREAEVVAWLKKFYDTNAVIWLVDSDPANDTTHGTGMLSQTPWNPSQLVYQAGGTNGNKWKSLYDYARDVSNITGTTRTFRAWRALMGMFCPSKYESCTSALYTQNNNHIIQNNNSSAPNNSTARTRVASLSGTGIKNQVVYDNAKNVADTISNVIRLKPMTVEMNDNVCVSMGLDVKKDQTSGVWTTNESKIGWIPLKSNELLFTDKGVKINLPNLMDPCEIKLNIAVEDTGAFRSSINAKYNEHTGLWEKDPNDGPVKVSLTPDGDEVILAQAEAATAVAWSFPTYKITGEIMHGEGEVVLNGFVVDEVNVAEGTSPEVVFRGKGGYVLDYLEVDGREIKDFDNDTYSWLFLDVGADHDIKVGFKSVFTTPYPNTTPRVETYDGTPYGPYCSEPHFLEGYEYEWYPVYSTDPNGEFTTTGGVTTVVYDENGNPAQQTVYTKIMIMQPGYEDGVVLDDWMGESTVTILPRPITVKFDDYAQTTDTRKSSDFSYQIVSGTLVDGDEFVNNSGRCTSYPNKGGKTVSSITSDGEMSVTTPGSDVNNYKITVIPGDYYYPNHEVVANANSIVKAYDGKATNTTVTVLSPTKTPTVDDIKKEHTGNQYNYIQNIKENEVIEYSIDGGKTWSRTIPDFTDVGEYEITYRVSYSYTFEHRRNTSSTWTTETVTYTPYEGTAMITILPRDVVVTAPSAEKTYDGSPLTAPGVTVTGFAEGEGFSKIGVTADSTITNPGSTANKVDKDHAVLKPNTDLKNYNIKYVDGKLTVVPNPITATATSVTKIYDGTPTDQIVVTPMFTNGTAFTEGTIYYRTTPDGPWTTTPPTPPTAAGEYPVYYKVDGGGYGTVEGVTTITVTPRTVKLRADDAEKPFDGTPLTDNGFTVVPTEGTGYGFVDGEGIESVTMTDDSQQTDVGQHDNKINVYDTEHWTTKPGTKIQNYVFEVLPGTLKVTGGPAIMIVDHTTPVDGYVDLCVKVQYTGENKFMDWYNPTNFAAKAGTTVEAMENAEPAAVQVVDIDDANTKVWIRVPVDTDSVNYYVRAYAFGAGVAWKHSNGHDALDFTDSTGVKSINIHAMLKIDSSTTNTMIAIPWKWYSEKPEEARDIPTKKLVSAAHLSDGDTLLQFTRSGTYSAWYMTEREWGAYDTAKVGVLDIADPKQETGYMLIKADDEDKPLEAQLSIKRGNGLWLCRKNPAAKTFWLYGQYTDEDCETEILPAREEVNEKETNVSKDGVTSNMIGNPFNVPVNINDLEFEGEINEKYDRLWIPNGTVTAIHVIRLRGMWVYATLDPGTRRTKYVTDIPVKPGLSFWYDRRSTKPMKIKWPRRK